VKVIHAQYATLALKLLKIFDLFGNITHGSAIMMTQTPTRPILKNIFVQGPEDQFLSLKRSVRLALNMSTLGEEESTDSRSTEISIRTKSFKIFRIL